MKEFPHVRSPDIPRGYDGNLNWRVSTLTAAFLTATVV